jgi:hypothetical protein
MSYLCRDAGSTLNSCHLIVFTFGIHREFSKLIFILIVCLNYYSSS